MQQKNDANQWRSGAAGCTFFFQIANDGKRRACRVTINASKVDDASTLFRDNWLLIESMARDIIKDQADGVIALDLP